MCIFLSCGAGEEPSQEVLERLYVGLVEQGIPGREPIAGELDSLRAVIDSLGGAAMVESLLIENMLAYPERWNSLIDSVSSLSR